MAKHPAPQKRHHRRCAGRALAIVSQAEKVSGKTTDQFAAQVAQALDTSTGSLNSKTSTEASTAAQAVQEAVSQGVSQAQAAGQIDQTQAAALVKAVSASPIAMVIKEGASRDSYLNADESTVDLVVKGTFAEKQTLQLLSGSNLIPFKVGAADSSVSSYPFTGAATEITITVSRSDLVDNASNSLKAQLSQDTSAVEGTVTSNVQVIVVDTQAPTVSKVTDTTDADVTKDPISFTVTFDEAVVGTVGTGNFSATNGTVTSVAQVGTTNAYTVVVTPKAGVASGNVALSLVADSLKDAAGNALVSADLSSKHRGQAIDTAAPSNPTLTPANAGGAHTADPQ
jgi:hypothetical protein